MSNNNKLIKESIKKYDELMENARYLTEEQKQMMNYIPYKESECFEKKYKQV